jgi:cell division septation protein DedD
MEESEPSGSGRPPRNWLKLLLGAAACAGVAVALFLVFSVPAKKEVAKGERPSLQPSDPARAASPPDPMPSNETDAPTTAGLAPSESGSPRTPAMPVVSLPGDAEQSDLENVVLPSLPYSIYLGAHKDFQEAATTQSELESNYLTAYVVPIRIKGNASQSLFGVTQDGSWYRVLTGHFGSKEEARNTLGFLMAELPGYQPEILRLPYAVECGRFLEPEDARELAEKLDKKDVFSYTQTYPTTDGRSLTRVLVGCFFSERGAQDQAEQLRKIGFSCSVAER